MGLFPDYIYIAIPLLVLSVAIAILAIINIFSSKKVFRIVATVLGILGLACPLIMRGLIFPSVMPNNVIVDYPTIPDATTKLSHVIASKGSLYFVLEFLSSIFLLIALSVKGKEVSK